MFDKTKLTAGDIIRALLEAGGPGSGHHGHVGIPGHRGGSAPKGGGTDKPKTAGQSSKLPRQLRLPMRMPRVPKPKVSAFDPGVLPPTKWKFMNTTAGAHAQAAQLFPHMKFDFNGGDLRTVNEVMTTFSRLAELFPETAQRLRGIGLTNSKIFMENTWENGSASAIFDSSANIIVMNPLYAHDRGELDAFYARAREQGHTASRSPEDTIAHEFGHAIDSYLFYKTQLGGEIRDMRSLYESEFYKSVEETALAEGYSDFEDYCNKHSITNALYREQELFSNVFTKWARGDRDAGTYAMSKWLKSFFGKLPKAA